MTREDPQFKLRMSSDLKSLVEQSAKENRRSINAEIIARLEQSFSGAEAPGRLTRGVDKQALLRNVETGETVSEAQLTAIISKALDGVLASWANLDVPPDNAKKEPNSGPKPRKRYTKK